jgi:hypothetical protein
MREFRLNSVSLVVPDDSSGAGGGVSGSCDHIREKDRELFLDVGQSCAVKAPPRNENEVEAPVRKMWLEAAIGFAQQALAPVPANGVSYPPPGHHAEFAGKLGPPQEEHDQELAMTRLSLAEDRVEFLFVVDSFFGGKRVVFPHRGFHGPGITTPRAGLSPWRAGA